MITHLYLAPLSAIPDGLVCRVFGQIHDGRNVVETREPISAIDMEPWDGIQANGIAIGIDDTTPGEWVAYKQEPSAVPDIALAAQAMATRALLATSDKLQSPQVLGMLDQLVDGVKSQAGATPDKGEAATALVNQMLDNPKVQANAELSQALASARDAVIGMTGGVL